MTELQRILSALRSGGLDVENVEDGEGALVREGEAQVALFAEVAEGGGVLVRLHLDLDLYVDEEALGDVLMGINLMNQGLDYGTLILDPVDDDDEDEAKTGDEEVSFAVLGRSVLWLTDLGDSELDRLRVHISRFGREVSEAIERSLQGEDRGIRA